MFLSTGSNQLNLLKKIAIVEDELELRCLVREVADRLGFLVEDFGDGRLIAPARFAEFDVIILDLMMPGMDAIELIRRISPFKKLNVIFMSGLSRKVLEGAERLARQHGFNVIASLQKPFRVSEVRDALMLASGNLKLNTASQAPSLTKPVTEREFESALNNDELLVHFQPKVGLAEERPWCGVEALMRWQHPVHGLLNPVFFVSYVERPEWAERALHILLRKAVEQAKILERLAGFRGMLSVNLPPAALIDHDITDGVLDCVDEDNFDRSRLILEITETSIPVDECLALEIATRLKIHGVRLSIDDFGTGYSSLERLNFTAFDEIKIDLTFVRRALTDNTARIIVENSIDLGRRLGMTVVAEGVENLDVMQWLSKAGCDQAQGYYVCKPMPPLEICSWAKACQ